MPSPSTYRSFLKWIKQFAPGGGAASGEVRRVYVDLITAILPDSGNARIGPGTNPRLETSGDTVRVAWDPGVTDELLLTFNLPFTDMAIRDDNTIGIEAVKLVTAQSGSTDLVEGTGNIQVVREGGGPLLITPGTLEWPQTLTQTVQTEGSFQILAADTVTDLRSMSYKIEPFAHPNDTIYLYGAWIEFQLK